MVRNSSSVAEMEQDCRKRFYIDFGKQLALDAGIQGYNNAGTTLA